MNIDKRKLLKSLGIIAAVFLIVGVMTQISRKGSMTLTEYARLHPEQNSTEESTVDETGDTVNDTAFGEAEVPTEDTVLNNTEDAENMTDNLQNQENLTVSDKLVGVKLNGDSQISSRNTYADGFYFEPLSVDLEHYITGVSFPSDDESVISYEDLRYLHIMYYNFEGNPAEGELICNQAIAQDLVEIFYSLYQNEYQLENVQLIDAYDGDDIASMEANNTSCFNYRIVAGSTSLSKHAYGLAIDINPLYNPYVSYEKDGTQNVSPVSASVYADRDAQFPYKIDENDLCYKLFKEHGFTWGGDWNSCKDYQHFQKTIK